MNPSLWHDDLHDDSIFVDPFHPENVTDIIAWQSYHVSPLFNPNPDLAFLDWDGLGPGTFDPAPKTNISNPSLEDLTTTFHESALYRATEFRKIPAFGVISSPHLDLKDSRESLPAVPSDTPFPFDFSEADIERIKLEGDASKHERYEDCRATLDTIKSQMSEQLAETDDEKAEYERYWPCD
ncbi:phosphotransferase enzyme family protein [Penicillium lividum]|nr:phosphotransferase enzyme family protein [Penicillium lividum]